MKAVLIDQRKKTTSEKLSLKLEWLAHSPRYKGMVSTYIWRPYILPPRTINADIRIRTDSQGSHNVLVHLQGWDHSKGALDKYKWNSIAGPSTYTRISSNPDREIQLHLYAMLKQLIMDSNTFVKTAYEEVTNLVSLYPIADVHFVENILCFRPMMEERAREMRNYIFCFTLVTAVVMLHLG